MLRKISILSLPLICSLLQANDAAAQWTSRPSLQTIVQCCRLSEGTLCVCQHAAFAAWNSGELQPITRSTGLSSAYVSAGAAAASAMAIGFEDGSIDIFDHGRKLHIDDATLGSPVESKRIRSIAMDGSLMLASGDFGLSLIDQSSGDVLASCRMRQPVLRCAFSNGKAMALTQQGVYSMDLGSQYFQDPDFWAQDYYDFGADYHDYQGPRPVSPPDDEANFMASADGCIAIASRHFCEISKSGLVSFSNPDGAVFTCAFYNPYNSSHVFLGDSNGTLFEYLGHSLKARHSGHIEGRIVGMDCTPEGDLLILSQNSGSPVSIFDHNGGWHIASSFKTMDCPLPLQLVKVSDYVFAVCMGSKGIFAVDLAGTPLDFSDDSYSSFYPSADSRIGSEVCCMAMDPSGRLIIGTNKGVAYSQHPENLAHGQSSFARPVVTEPLGSSDTYSQYLLSSKRVSSIAVDAAGRKWIATHGQGVFLVSDDMSEEILRLNERNSLLPSDSVMALSIVQRTGEVFFATRNGLASYLSDVQEASDDLSQVLVYPNPVRPDYDGDISISGLEDGCDVRIADISGHLVFRSESQGGRVSWDGLNLNGRRCSTGVYLIFVTNKQTEHKTVKKLLIVR